MSGAANREPGTPGRCGSCRHWKEPENDYGEVPGTGDCQAVPQFWDVTEWRKDCDKRVLKPGHAGRLAFVRDGSDHLAVLKTLPDFGCVQWAQRNSVAK